MNHEQKHFIGQLFLQFIRKQILNGDFTFDDGRSAVIHILDAFYRADAQKYRFLLFIDCYLVIWFGNIWPPKTAIKQLKSGLASRTFDLATSLPQLNLIYPTRPWLQFYLSQVSPQSFIS